MVLQLRGGVISRKSECSASAGPSLGPDFVGLRFPGLAAALVGGYALRGGGGEDVVDGSCGGGRGRVGGCVRDLWSERGICILLLGE